jgi:hypothetical protein
MYQTSDQDFELTELKTEVVDSACPGCRSPVETDPEEK